MKRYYVLDRQKGMDVDRVYTSLDPRWLVIDRETNLPVDEGLTRYEANLAARNLNS